MSDIEALYDIWSETYDSVRNRTRDLEVTSLQWALERVANVNHCLEVGCGTAKNTNVLLQQSQSVTAVDLSSSMLEKGRQKVSSQSASFLRMDINERWELPDDRFDLITFSLVLLHIEDLDHVFSQAARVTANGGIVYVGEMHPFKVYTGSKAWFDHGDLLLDVPCFNHDISDYVRSALRANLKLVDLNEYFDRNDNTSTYPRILSLIFKKE